MGFMLTLATIAVIAGLLSAVIAIPIYRMKKPHAKLIAVVVVVILFPLLSWAGFVLLIVVSARQGHPF
jgi:hypothetical protein